MFISRREWEDMCDQNRKLLKNKEDNLLKIEYLEEQLRNAEKHNLALQEELKHKDNVNDIQKESLETYKRDNDTLLTANQKLTDWVNKIINEVGIYEVEDRRSVTIPIVKNPVRAIGGKWDDVKDELPNFLSQEEIIIPEIRFVRMK